MTIFILIVVASWAVFIGYWLFSSLGAKRTVRGGSWRIGAAIRVAILIVAIALAHFYGKASFVTDLDRLSSSASNPALGALGALCSVLGIGLAVWARRYLGRNWGMPMSHKENPELATTGPYAYIRHPIYAGVLLAILGSALAASLAWLIIFAVAAVYFIYSAKTEERMALAEFPDAYPAYMARTKMLIPFVL